MENTQNVSSVEVVTLADGRQGRLTVSRKGLLIFSHAACLCIFGLVFVLKNNTF